MHLHRISKFSSAVLLLIGSIFCFSAQAVEPLGEYVLGGKGTLLLTFDGAGNFAGQGAIYYFGVVNIQGMEATGPTGAITGTFTLTDQVTSAVLFSGMLSGKATAGDKTITIKLATHPAQSFTGGLRTGNEAVPSGQYFKTTLPTSLIFQLDQSGDRQTVTLQGDQDFGLDLTQAVGGQILFGPNGRGYGVVYENGDRSNPPRWSSAQYTAIKDTLILTLGTALFGGKRKSLTFTGVGGSSGKYDGVYTFNISAGNCAPIPVKITVKNGIATGSDPSTGTITGTIDDAGNLFFTSPQLVIAAGCSASGTYGTITYTGTPTTGPVYPQILNGTFSGTGVAGTFTVLQPSGITGATTPVGLQRDETWSGTLVGVHDSKLLPGGVYAESFTLTLSFPSSLIAALRGINTITSGSGTMSGSETVQTQVPLTAIGMINATTLGGANVNVTFAGMLNAKGRSIQIDSTSILITNSVTYTAGPNNGKTLGEDRQILKMRVETQSAILVGGAWNDGKFVLRKQQ